MSSRPVTVKVGCVVGLLTGVWLGILVALLFLAVVYYPVRP